MEKQVSDNYVEMKKKIKTKKPPQKQLAF